MTQAILLAALVGGVLLSMALLGARNPVLLRLGLRNTTRRPAQSLTIVVGLVLSAALITLFVALPDSLNASTVANRLALAGSVDETVTGPLTQNQVTQLWQNLVLGKQKYRDGGRFEHMKTKQASLLEVNDTSKGQVEAVQVCKTYDTGRTSVQALKGVSLQIQPGEVVAIMGPSGCGKTTLLNCLSGLDSVSSGTIKIAGQDIRAFSDRELTAFRAREMGFVFQTYNLLPVLTGLENVELPLLVSGVSPGEARARARASIELVGLLDWARHRPAEMSGGQRQRFAIARALATMPSIVWADEPTGALDSATSQEIIALMLRLNREHGLTFVWVTHALEVAQQAHRLVTMRDGLIEADRSLKAESSAPSTLETPPSSDTRRESRHNDE